MSWSVGDTHPEAPWTKNGYAAVCPTCGKVGKQGNGVDGLDWIDRKLVDWCREHRPERLGLDG